MGEKFIFPLKQGIGAPSEPGVFEGSSVRRGEKIATKPVDGLGSNIFSSIDGIVKSVSENEIIIEKSDDSSSDYIHLKKDEPLKMIEESGLVGLGGAGFPTYAKLSKPIPSEGRFIINAAECEPILSHNIDSIELNPKPLIRGIEIVMEILKAQRATIAIKAKHEKAVSILKDALKENGDDRIDIHLLSDMYPMGEERALVREVMGKLLPVDEIPMAAGCVVSNVETVEKIYEIVDLQKPLIDKDVTIAGKINNEEKIHIFHNFPIGMTVADAFALVGEASSEAGELIMGGPFTGKRTSPESPIIKTTGGLIATECFPKGPSKIGLLVCACGADEKRLRELAASYGSEVTGVEFCKQALETRGTRKCLNPGKCPGQVAKVMNLKKSGAQAILISNCTDCTNTVMSCAPKLGLPVYHATDLPLRACNIKLVRKIKEHID